MSVNVVLAAIELAPESGDSDAAGSTPRERRVLIARRSAGQHLAGYWELPGGKRRLDETARAALARELAEELGLVVDPRVDRALDVQIRSDVRANSSLGDAAREGASGATEVPSRGSVQGASGWGSHSRIRRCGEVIHVYPDRRVRLEAFQRSIGRRERQTLSSRGAEGQWLAWVHPVELRWLRWPPANRRFIDDLGLPETLAISLDPGSSLESWMAWWASIEASGPAGVPRQIQLRAPSLPVADRCVAFTAALAGLKRLGWRGRLWLNPGRDDPAALADAVMGAGPVRGVRWGWHLPESVWRSVLARVGLFPETDQNALDAPVSGRVSRDMRAARDAARSVLAALGLVGEAARRPWMAAVHDAEGLRQIETLDVSMRPEAVTLSPVRPTPTHPQAEALGSLTFARLARRSAVPVYALGGLTPAATVLWRRLGAQGVAGIRGFW